MAGGGSAAAETAVGYGGATSTGAALLACLVAASGGLIFGYDTGISGGVTTMEPFLRKFFPGVHRRGEAAPPDKYCVYNSQVLTTFTSSLYLAALLSSLVAARLTATAGRRAVMIAAGALYLAGATINAAAENLVMLISGRLLLGLGVGFANQATPIYLAEMAPTKWRGALISAFQLSIFIGGLSACLVNYVAAQFTGDRGWRLALGLAAVPAAIFLLGSASISDAPTRDVLLGHVNGAREALLCDVDKKREGMLHRGQGAIFRRKYRGYLVVGVMIKFFHHMTGIYLVAFYAPVMLRSIGFGGSAALLGAAGLAGISLGAVLASSFIVDRYGRKVLFMVGGAQMFLCQVAMGSLFLAMVGVDGAAQLPRAGAGAVLIIQCIYVAGFGCSWGPLSWIVPSEIFPAEVRPAGQSIVIAVHFFICFVLAQILLAALCWMKYSIFFFFAGWMAVMTIFVAVFVPETKGVPMESMEAVWASHWFWRRYVE